MGTGPTCELAGPVRWSVASLAHVVFRQRGLWRSGHDPRHAALLLGTRHRGHTCNAVPQGSGFARRSGMPYTMPAVIVITASCREVKVATFADGPGQESRSEPQSIDVVVTVRHLVCRPPDVMFVPVGKSPCWACCSTWR